MTFHTLRLILGDQLNAQHSWYRETADSTLYVLMEIIPETQYVQHHIQKICGFFLAMRAFAAQLEANGHQVQYFKLDDANNLQDFAANCTQLIEQHHIQRFEYQLPDEWRVDRQLLTFCQNLGSSKAFDSEHFFSTRTELAELFSGKKTYLMESFWKQMTKRR